MDKLIDFLKNKIEERSSLEEIVNVFERMCSIPLEEDMILFETGTFTTSADEPMFQISLVRQFPNEDEEFYQIHVDIFYETDDENKKMSESMWDEDLSENIFDYIRNSKAFAYAKSKEYHKVKIWCDET
nr:hypothetical protein [Shuttleworthia satelles]